MAVTVDIETITPSTAKEWLTLNTLNRKPRNTKIEQFSHDVASNRWRLTGDSIKIGYNGATDEPILIDGQNRLYAIVKANKPIESVVVRGLSYSDVMPVVDTGAARTFSDTLRLRKELNYAALAAVTNAFWRQEQKMMHSPLGNASHQDLLSLLDARPELRDAAALAIAMRAHFPIRLSAFGAALVFGWDIDEEVTTAYAKAVETGEGLVRKEPAYMFRQWVVNASSTNRRPTSLVYAAVTNKALTAALEGRELGVLRWSPSEDFPYLQDIEIITAA